MKLQKPLAILAGASLLSLAQQTVADNHTDVAQLASKVKQLEQQLSQMQKGQSLTGSAKGSRTTRLKENRRTTFTSKLGGMPVATSPYLGQQTSFDGSHLLVMYPSVNEDLRLLHYRRHAEDSLNTMHVPQPDEPFIKLSGSLEGLASANRGFDSTKSNDVDLDTANLAVMMGVSRYVTGFLTFDYNSGESKDDIRRAAHSNVFMNKGFITIGNLNEFPLYVSFGQMYPAFGRYSSAMVTAPLTLRLGRFRNRAISLGYSSQDGTGFYGSVFAFKGETRVVGEESKVNEGGANLDYVFDAGKVHADIGVSYVSNLAESYTLTHDDNFGAGKGEESLQKRVAGGDIHALVMAGPVRLLAEYVTALEKFDQADLTYRDKAAKPRALQVELGYDFNIDKLPSNFSIGYNQSYQSAAVGLAKKSYLAVFNTSVLKDTMQALEFRHDVEYNEVAGSAKLNGVDEQVGANTGRHSNTVSLLFGIYF